jgi:hypothetical protein
VEFLSAWCNEEELAKTAQHRIPGDRGWEAHESKVLYLNEPPARTSHDNVLQQELIVSAKSFLRNKMTGLSKHISDSDHQLRHQAESFVMKGDYSKAIQLFERIKNKSDEEFVTLGICFIIQKKVKDAETCFLAAAEKNNGTAMSFLALLYLLQNTKKIQALDYAARGFQGKEDFFSGNIYAMVLIWTNDYIKANDIVKDILCKQDSMEIIQEQCHRTLLLFIAKKQYHLTYALFSECPLLKDLFKPIYFCLMYFMQEEYPDEYRRMGGEFRETVEELIRRAGALEKKYG